MRVLGFGLFSPEPASQKKTIMAKAQRASESRLESYRRIQAEKALTETFADVECKHQPAANDFPAIDGCGMTWKARRVAKTFWVMNGVLPSALTARMVAAGEKSKNKQKVDPGELIKAMKAEDIVSAVDFANAVVRTTAVDPRIVDVVENPDTDIQRAEVFDCCYNTLLRWQMAGGDEAAGLDTFPDK